MKNKFALIISMLFVITLTACAVNNENTINNQVKQPEIKLAVNPTIMLNETTPPKETKPIPQETPEPTQQPTPLSDEDKIISQLDWNNFPREITYKGITYKIDRELMPIDKRAGTGIRYKEIIYKVDYRLPLKDRVITVLRTRIIN